MFARLVQVYDAGKTKQSLKKKKLTNKSKYMTQETAAQNNRNQLKFSTESEKIEDIKRKPEHRQFYWEREWALVDKEKSLLSLCSSRLKGETESLIAPAPG